VRGASERGLVDGGWCSESSEGMVSDVSRKLARKGNRVRRNLYWKQRGYHVSYKSADAYQVVCVRRSP